MSFANMRFSTANRLCSSCFFFFNDTATTEIYTLSLHDALPISIRRRSRAARRSWPSRRGPTAGTRSEEHTSELQSLRHIVCRLLLEKKKNPIAVTRAYNQQPQKKHKKKPTKPS